MRRLAALEAQRVSAKLRFEAAWRVGDPAAEIAAQDELEEIDLQVKRVLAEIENADK